MKILKKVSIKKATAFVMVFLMVLGVFPKNVLVKNTYAASDYIIGSGNHWADEYIKSLYDRGIMKGDADGAMNPDRDITRAEFAAILNRTLSYKTKTPGRLPFSDVKGTEWYSDDISIAYNASYFMGVGKSQSGALDNLTREQAITLISRNVKLEDISGQNSKFTDNKDISYWSRGAVNAATNKNMISGYQDGTFRPTNNITRGESAKLISTAFGEIINTQGEKSYGVINGNATISASGVTLKDTTITGDLYITKGVGLGFTNLENVKVLGEIIISGSGESNSAESSIKMRDCTAGKVIINSSEANPVSLKVEGTTTINETLVKTSAFLEELTNGAGGYKNVVFDGEEESELHLLGEFEKVSVKGPKTHFYLDSGSIAEFTMDEEATDSDVNFYEDTYVDRAYIDVPTKITGWGEIGYININSDGVTVQSLPDEIVIRPGSTANIYGREMTSKQAQEASDFPRILSKYPTIDEVDSISGTAVYKTNKKGTLYWTISLDDDGAPSTDEILRPNKVKSVIKFGNMNVTKIDEEFRQSISGLKRDTDYILSAVLVDERKDESQRKKENFSTLDDSKPAFNTGYPIVKSTDNSTVDMYASTNKNCTLYWVALDKGSTAPTATELLKQNLSGSAAKGTVKNVKKNIESTFKASGLEEVASYDIYFLLSDGENDSKVYKYNATTLDKTAPSFLEGYPKMDKMTDKSVDVKYNVNESGNVFYIVLKKGGEFPPTVIIDPGKPPSPPPSLSSEEAKQAVLTGNNAFKAGKTSATESKEGKFTISGLSAETAYDVYAVVQDKAGNTSDVSKISIKTLDNIPPKVTQEFEDEIDGNPTASTEIRIVFSEEVLDRNTLKSFTKEILKEYKNIILYDMSSNKKTEVEIDFDKAVIKDLDDTEGKTVISFPDDAIELNAGNSYQFEVSKIVDTSNNKMQDKTLLPMFTTVAPLVELVKPLASPLEVDMSFEIYPQSTNTNNNVLFDLIFESDSTIRFELYEREIGDDQFTLVSQAGSESAPLVLAKKGITLHSIIESKSGTTPTTLEFEPFNQLKEKEYGIKIVSVDGDGDPQSWNSSVKITVKAVIGSKTNLNYLAAEPAGRFEQAIKQGVVQVDSFPRPFELMVTFADRRTPAFLEGYPKIDGYVGDVFINPFIAATKACTVYYMVAPAGSVIINPEPDEIPEIDPDNPAQIISEGYITRPSSIEIITNKVKPDLAVSGTTEISSPGSVYNFLVEGLEPNKGYDIFYVLKGEASDPSQVYYQRFVTSQIKAPILSDLNILNKTDSSFDVKLTVDKNCMLYWVVYDSTYFDPDDPNGLVVTPYMIKNASEDTSYIPAGFGTQNVTLTTQELNDKKKEVTISVTGLDRSGGIFYNFYVIGQSTINKIPTGLDSEIKSFERIILRDATVPMVTVLTSFDTPYDDTTRLFNGIVTITFSEDMYYVQNVGDPKQPLTFSAFRKNLNINPSDDIQVEEGNNPRSFFAISDYGSANNKDTKEPMLRYVVITFKNVPLNRMMYFPHILMDDSGNIVGRMTLTLKRDANKGVYWNDTYQLK